MNRILRTLILCLTGLLSIELQATDWGFCGPGLQLPERPSVEGTIDDLDTTLVSADEANLVEEGTSVLKGNVQVVQGSRQIQADTVRVTRPERILDAEGNIRYWDTGLYISGETMHGDLGTDFATVDEASYVVLDAHAHGDTDRVTLSNRDLLNIEKATYTTCNPDDVIWSLDAGEIELHRISEWGSAKDVFVRFKGAPIFYSPFLSFPLTDKRKTGFLTPSYRFSDLNGFEVRLPYYWNIAPNQDATVTARGMTNRGILLEGEYRYLTEHGRGDLGLEYLPHDSIRGGDRAAVSFQHEGSFSPGWSTDIDVDWVSDQDYFSDLGTNLAIASQQFLERRGDLTYQQRHWFVRAQIDDYQTIDDAIAAADRPYKRLPQLYFEASTPERNRRLNADVNAEFVYFDRSSSVTGTRVNLAPSVSYPIRTAATYVVPKVSLDYTTYSLDGTAAGAEDNPDRLLPTFSTDAGIFLEKELTLGNQRYVHTIEPRVFYLFVPEDDQDQIPVFDSGEFTFNFSQLFRTNRFSGVDRVGDANQLTLALSSRLLSSNKGEEIFRASIGQIIFFRDREVQLSDDTPIQTDGTSDFVAELSTRLFDDWRATAGYQWNTEHSRTDRNTMRVRYQPDEQRVFNAEYRFIRDTIEQTDVSFRWPIHRNWGVVGRWNYALPEERTLDVFGGVEYDSCCWAARALVRRFLRNNDGDFDNAVYLQLELKGLAGLGKSAEAFLKKSIPGYRNTF